MMKDRLAPITSADAAFGYFESFTNLEKVKLTNRQRSFRLDRMEELLSHFDNPHRRFKSFHIAGTKGKGSTAVMLASILQSNGLKTGLYTSPHVSSYLERINVSLSPPEEPLIVELANKIKDTIEALASALPGDFPPTTFELLTLLAFMIFRETKCEYAVLETGIGGRLDATNVVIPEASLLTPLDLEHTELLGETIEQIAIEKAGIIKPGIPAFCGYQTESVKKIFREICQERKAPLYFLEDEASLLEVELRSDGTRLTMQIKGEDPVDISLAMRGIFQAENAALVYLTVSKMLPSLPFSALHEGFERAILPGRMEVVNTEPMVMLDGAHTPLAIRRLLESYTKMYPRKGVLIFGSVSGKDHRHMAELLAPHFSSIIISKPGRFKPNDPQEVFDIFRSFEPKIYLIEDPAKALRKALELSKNSLPILVTGSFYMICEIRQYFPLGAFSLGASSEDSPTRLD